MAAVTPRRARLGARLRALRAVTYPSGLQFAGAVGWPQSRVSKLERGAQLPTEDDLLVWLRATGHPDDLLVDLLVDLLDQVAAARVDYTADRAALAEGGFVVRQSRRGRDEAQTTRIVEYQPAMLPGLVQTPAYARELLTNSVGGLAGIDGGTEQVEGVVAERIKRQELLYEPRHNLEVLIGEAALYNRPGAVETMIGQLDRLESLAGLSTVELGVLSFNTPMTVLPLSNFAVHDDELVIIESLGGEQQHTEPEEVATYLDATSKLWAVAARGPDALAIIRRATRAQPSAG